MKKWSDEQKAANLEVLVERDLATEVAQSLLEAKKETGSFESFYTQVGLLSVPSDFAEDLDNELWNMRKNTKETVSQFAARMRENARLLAEFPEDSEEIPEVQQMRYAMLEIPREL
ncbi:hypothetical protein PC129_g22666 [Phytophthora cactorum]|uniref:Retrotransposon gag domain-containing protein n=1 Tax=Phytophthora cactorum TaxID=29920 RepID=A0A329R8I9_9STRA|nr:hypothetical protein Pcac1_g20067 [Phytophthora cactorum]KAG2798015.1 hypothetical protein PC111_g21033 [Phytophthora cactorum]KAG2798102.1 hypothetical protein PC112_g21500 [Phytophthora cactorum]KAG2842909.1 hypothetical protein PC113_g18717 [Phytophthora cactorum]KAG2873488.1 hypothetical protein PC114_g25823 [Phytophthora cactorum]